MKDVVEKALDENVSVRQLKGEDWMTYGQLLKPLLLDIALSIRIYILKDANCVMDILIDIVAILIRFQCTLCCSSCATEKNSSFKIKLRLL